jgi:hypothetical protein
MSKSWDSGAISVVVTGVQVATGAASAGGTLPVVSGSTGGVPRYIRVAATAACYMRIGAGAQTAVAGDLMVQPGDAVILEVSQGITNYAAIQVAAAGVIQISPLENV